MSEQINRDDPKRWFIIQNNESGEESIVVFGNAGDQGETELTTGQPILLNYLTETELQTKINEVTGIPGYYKDAVELADDKFQQPSGLYSYASRAK